MDVDTVGDAWREDDGRGAFWEFVGSKEDMEVTDCGDREESGSYKQVWEEGKVESDDVNVTMT